MKANEILLIELEVKDAMLKQMNESLTAFLDEIKHDVNASIGRVEAKMDDLPTRAELEKYVCAETTEFLQREDFKPLFIKTNEEVSSMKMEQWKLSVDTVKGFMFMAGLLGSAVLFVKAIG